MYVILRKGCGPDNSDGLAVVPFGNRSKTFIGYVEIASEMKRFTKVKMTTPQHIDASRD